MSETIAERELETGETVKKIKTSSGEIQYFSDGTRISNAEGEELINEPKQPENKSETKEEREIEVTIHKNAEIQYMDIGAINDDAEERQTKFDKIKQMPSGCICFDAENDYPILIPENRIIKKKF